MRLFLILVMAAVAMAWRKWRARRQAEDAQRRLVQMLIDQAADEEARADREIDDNLF
mgnify:CR=1 FL=1